MIFEIISEILQEGRTEVQRRGDHERKGRLWREGGTAHDKRDSSTDKNLSQPLLKRMVCTERYIKIIVTTIFKIVHNKLLKKRKVYTF